MTNQNCWAAGFSYQDSATRKYSTSQSQNMVTNSVILRNNLNNKNWWFLLTFSCQKDLYTMKLSQNKRGKVITIDSEMLQRASHQSYI